jgi:hypothetical protein
VASRVVQIKPWGQTSDREFDIAGRRPREFYRIADELLRYEVELARLHAHTKDSDSGLRIGELSALVEDRRRKLYAYPYAEERTA